MLKTPAFLYDGNKQLAGALSVAEEGIRFYFSDFNKSHLDLYIALSDIERLEIFQLYNLTTNGLKVICYGGREDLFILQRPWSIKKSIEQLKRQRP